MEKYRGFLIESKVLRHEIKEWDGHRNERTGQFEETYGYSIINPRSAKSCWVKGSFEDAKKLVDKIKDNKEEDLDARRAIKAAKAELVQYEANVEAKIKNLKESIYEKRREVRNLEESLKDNLLPNFH